MLVADKRETEEMNMPVRELPMPPVQVQRPDNSGNSAFYVPKPNEALPVPQLSALQLTL